jgi:transposase
LPITSRLSIKREQLITLSENPGPPHYVEGLDRRLSFLLPACVDDYVGEHNPVRVVDAFVDELDLAELGFGRSQAIHGGDPGLNTKALD